jgi:hypothetical protein
MDDICDNINIRPVTNLLINYFDPLFLLKIQKQTEIYIETNYKTSYKADKNLNLSKFLLYLFV